MEGWRDGGMEGWRDGRMEGRWNRKEGNKGRKEGKTSSQLVSDGIILKAFGTLPVEYLWKGGKKRQMERKGEKKVGTRYKVKGKR
jgi:hypothetical protein